VNPHYNKMMALQRGAHLPPRAADEAVPRANVGGFLFKNHMPTVMEGW